MAQTYCINIECLEIDNIDFEGLSKEESEKIMFNFETALKDKNIFTVTVENSLYFKTIYNMEIFRSKIVSIRMEEE